jgi:hypothetical protein
MRPGDQLVSVVCTTKVVVIRGSTGHKPCCGGHELVPMGAPVAQAQGEVALMGGTLLGKRYECGDLELLCVSPGTGTLTCDGAVMTIKAPKPLPASD